MAITINGSSGISGVDGSAATPALRGSDTNSGFIFSADQVSTVTGGVSRATVDSSGYLRLASNGIQFNGDTAAANALDDYEEGEWTPVATAYSGTITINRATYCKIGALVHIQAYISFSNTADGDLVALSVPFANNFRSTHTWNPISAHSNSSAMSEAFVGRIEQNSNQLLFKTIRGDNGVTYSQVAATWLIFAGTYLTSA